MSNIFRLLVIEYLYGKFSVSSDMSMVSGL